MGNVTEENSVLDEVPHPLPAKVRALLPSLIGQQHAVARALLDDPVACSRMTVSDLAEHARTSDTTVVRTARMLGYRGYRELRHALVELAALVGAASAPAVVGTVALTDPLPEVVAKLAAEERQVLADTAAQLDCGALALAIEAVCRARRIDVYGIGSSGSVADDLAAKMMRIGLVAHAHADAHRAMTSAVHLGETDVAIGVSHSGTTCDVVDPLRTAGDNGATTIGVTSHPRSPVAHYADVLLATAAAARGSDLRSVSMSSRTSQLLVVDCLFTGAAQRTYHAGAQRGLAASFQAVQPRHQATPPRG